MIRLHLLRELVSGTRHLRLLAILAAVVMSGEVRAQDDFPVEPVVANASEEGVAAMASIKMPPSVKAELVASEPDVANIVAFTIDDQGRIFVCETFRQEQGVTDNRSHDENWVDHDLAALTVEDRIAYHKELLPDQAREYRRQDDRIRMLQDTNGDGRVDTSNVFANCFNEIEDGTGAGVLVMGDRVFFTCIPHLWSLRDTSGDGQANERISLQDGFGVRVAFRGHDMHGLVRGPDGRIYFSIGDRGYHLETAEGKTFANPESGAVFRCQPDGSGLEVVATGLRNPQELAFDNFGNLFTGDNNSDSGDRARWVYILPSSDSGWRMSYQYLSDRGPFNREKIWHPFHQEQPVFIVPPITNIGDGPSGVEYYPGTGFAGGFENHFFMCDFRGGTAQSGIRSFRMEPKGAFYELVDSKEPVWQVLATDIKFGPDGYLYVSDWVNGWVGEGKGRIYRLLDENLKNSNTILDVRDRLAADITNIESKDLLEWLGHIDQRVRLKAQWSLAERNEATALSEVAIHGESQFKRLHAIWGLWQIGLKNDDSAIEKTIELLLGDEDPEVRAQSIRVVGELTLNSMQSHVVAAIQDKNPRVQMMAGLALANLPTSPQSINSLVDLLEKNDNQDPALRHAAIMGLTAAEPKTLVELAKNNESIAMRRATVVVLRKLNSELVAEFLNDRESIVADEAARAVYDLPLVEALPQLAQAVFAFPAATEYTRRAMNACYRVGGTENVRRLCDLALDETFSNEQRVAAIRLIGQWSQAKTRDAVIGMWRPIAAKNAEEAQLILVENLSRLLGIGQSAELKSAVVEALRNLDVKSSEVTGLIARIAADVQQPTSLRRVSLLALDAIEPQHSEPLAIEFLKDTEPQMRIAARQILADRRPEIVVEHLVELLGTADSEERKSAFAALAKINHPKAVEAFEKQLTMLAAGEVPADTRLDLRMAIRAQKESSENLFEQLDEYESRLTQGTLTERYVDSTFGGNAEKGRKLFFERTQLSCLRCHRIGEDGGNVGPNLSGIGLKRTREFLLQSIVEPNAQITEKFGTVVILDDSGLTVTGILHMENKDAVRLITAEGEFVTVAQDAIVERRTGESAMPKNLIESLDDSELRDLVEYLTTLKSEPQPDVESLEIEGQSDK